MAAVSDSGEPVLIDDPNDERLLRRNAGHGGDGVFSAMVARWWQRDTGSVYSKLSTSWMEVRFPKTIFSC